METLEEDLSELRNGLRDWRRETWQASSTDEFLSYKLYEHIDEMKLVHLPQKLFKIKFVKEIVNAQS